MTDTNKIKTVLPAALLHAAVALPLAYFLNIWADEASTLYTTQNGFFSALQNALPNEKQAPLYFFIMGLWREIDSSVFFARLFSILCSLLAIKFFRDLAGKLWDKKTAFFLTLVFAVHPYLFWASLEVRLYSLVILLSLVLLNLFYDGFMRENAAGQTSSSQKTARFLYAAAAIVALYTNYHIGFLLVGGFLALIVLQRFKAARDYFLIMLAVGIVFLPMLWIVKSQIGVRTGGYEPETGLIEGLKIIWNHFLIFVLPTEIFPAEEQSLASFFRVWIVRITGLSVLFLLVTKKRRLEKKVIIFFCFTAVCGVFLLALYLQMGEAYAALRHAAVMFAPALLLAFAALWSVRPQNEKKLRIYTVSLVFLYVVFSGYSLTSSYPQLTKRGDWARVGSYIEQNEKPGQPIFVLPVYESLALPYHYKGVNEILPDENFFRWDLDDELGSPNSMKNEIEYLISEIPPGAAEIWLVTNERCAVKDTCLPLKNFVEANYTIVEERDFYKEKVQLLRKK